MRRLREDRKGNERGPDCRCGSHRLQLHKEEKGVRDQSRGWHTSGVQ
jgi:hypothetical protein